MANSTAPIKTWRALRELKFGDEMAQYGDLVPEVLDIEPYMIPVLEGQRYVEVIYVTQDEIDSSVAARTKRNQPEPAIKVKSTVKRKIVRKAGKDRVLAEASI